MLRRRPLLLGLPTVLAAQPEGLRIATGDYPPYTDPRRGDGGLVNARVRAAFAQQGISLNWVWLPWSRALEETRAGRYDALSYWWAGDELADDFLRSSPLVRNALRWLRRRDQPLRAGAAVAWVIGYNYPPPVLAEVQRLGLRKLPVRDDLAGVRLVLAGRAAALPVDSGNACALLQERLDRSQRELLMLEPEKQALDLRSGHLLLPRARAGSAGLLASFEAGLAATLKDAALAKDAAATCTPPG